MRGMFLSSLVVFWVSARAFKRHYFYYTPCSSAKATHHADIFASGSATADAVFPAYEKPGAMAPGSDPTLSVQLPNGSAPHTKP